MAPLATLVLVAHRFPAVTIAAERASAVPAETIPLIRDEIRHLFIFLGTAGRSAPGPLYALANYLPTHGAVIALRATGNRA